MGSPLLDVRVGRTLRGWPRVVASGDLDIATTPRLEEVLALVEADGSEVIVVDLRWCRFIDSTGLGALVAARGRSLRKGWRLVLVRAPAAPQRIFQITMSESKFEFVGDPDEV